jgi:translation elongation factor EF-1beta
MNENDSVVIALGDPSGRQDATYWNQWFKAVSNVCVETSAQIEDTTTTTTKETTQEDVNTDDQCGHDIRAFEWYCDTPEIETVLLFHLGRIPRLSSKDSPVTNNHGLHHDYVHHDVSSTSTTSTMDLPNLNRRWMIHPGSGTSLLPIQLCHTFPNYGHVVVDISEVAIAHGQHLHQVEESKLHQHKDRSDQLPKLPGQHTFPVLIEYLQADLLLTESPLNSLYTNNMFDAWIDKGFMDAVFANNEKEYCLHEDENISDTGQCYKTQARQLLAEANRLLGDFGVALIVTLAEQHTIRLLLSMFYEQRNLWYSDLHVWEVSPISGSFRPFVFVFTKFHTNGVQPIRMVWHSTSSNNTDSADRIDRECDLFMIVAERILQAQTVYAVKQRQRHAMMSVPSTMSSPQNLMRTIIEIMPCSLEVDLMNLAQLIRQTTVVSTDDVPPRLITIQWCPLDVNNGGRDQHEKLWEEIIPIAFGISKLVLSCVIDRDDVEAAVEHLQQSYSDIQSTFVDWTRSTPVQVLTGTK